MALNSFPLPMSHAVWVNDSVFEPGCEPDNQEAWLDPKVEKYCSALPLDKTKLKTMIIGGIPSQLRKTIYPKLLKVSQLEAFERDFLRSQTRTYGLVIPPDPIPPTFGGRSQQNTLALTPAGSVVVRHILCIVAHDNPMLEYCPFLPPLVELLAHHIDSADTLLGCVNSLLQLNSFKHPSQSSLSQPAKSLMPGESSSSRRWGYIPVHHKEAKLFSRAFGNLLYQTDRKLHAHVTDLHSTSPDPFWTSWIQNMFIHVLPQPLLWRFLDSFLVEGYKAFLRFGMAILIYQRSAILQMQSIWEINQLITPALFSDDALKKSSKHATIADKICAIAAGVFINYANVKRVHQHHASLAAVSQESTDSIDVVQNSLKYQRALPKFVGLGVAAAMFDHQQQQQRASELEYMGYEEETDAESQVEADTKKSRRPVSCMNTLGSGQIIFTETNDLDKLAVPAIDMLSLQNPQIDIDLVEDADESDNGSDSEPPAALSISHANSRSSSPSPQPVELLPASTIADTDCWVALWSWIPPHKRMDAIELVFTTKVHGYNLRSLYHTLHRRFPIILAIETTKGETFGAYLSDGIPDLREEPHFSGKWIGTGESFVFSLVPHAKMFPWVGRLNETMTGASFFVNVTQTSLTIGGGGDHVAIQLDSELRYGFTGKCTTFMNDCFTMDKSHQFECLIVEAFAFTHV
ncbi:hypothetical protein BDEG_23491 [Batrachochytrium dendrobatidis JEL423]|nr:hypothetical protein BDEG_23491 [Batrachochytrium dendrobatidis JEL423]